MICKRNGCDAEALGTDVASGRKVQERLRMAAIAIDPRVPAAKPSITRHGYI